MLRYSKWLDLPFTTRIKLASIFDITKTGPTEVASNQVVKDGFSLKELEEKITTETMQAYLEPVDTEGMDDDKLFELTVEKATYVPPTPVAAQEVTTKTTIIETVTRPVETVTPPAPEVTPKVEEVISEENTKNGTETKKGSKK